MTYEDAKAQRIHITIEYAKNDVERYLLRREEPIPKCIALAMDALDKQIPKPPKITIHGTTDLNMTVKCPSCHGLVFDYKFCPHCGQAIKREERAYTPPWEDMCSLMDMFFREDETVVQYHPAKSEYVNNMPKPLHPWRPLEAEFPTPPTIMVGVKKGQTAEDIRRPTEEEGEKQ